MTNQIAALPIRFALRNFAIPPRKSSRKPRNDIKLVLEEKKQAKAWAPQKTGKHTLV